MRIQLRKGETLVHSTTETFVPDYKNRDQAMTADVTIEIDHAGLLALIRKAGFNKSKRSTDGPITIKLTNIRGS